MKKWKVLLMAGAMAALFALAACSSGGGAPAPSGSGSSAEPEPAAAAAPADSGKKVAVGSKSFTEAYVLGELYSLALEDAGYDVDRVFNLSIDTVMPALQKGDVDMYAEYLGTALTDILKKDVEMDKDKAYETVKKGFADEYTLTYLPLTNMEDKVGIVMLKSRADELGVSSISDLQKVSEGLVFGDGVTFSERPDDLPRLEEYYGPFGFKIETVEAPMMYSLLEDGTVDVIPGLTTDPQLADSKFIVLKEDIPVWPPQYVAPVVRTETLAANPDMEDILNNVSSKLTTDDMIVMLDRIVNGGEEFEDVAKDFYQTKCK